MVGLLVHLLPLALYGAIAPVAALVCILFLESSRPRRVAGAYGLGYAGALVVTGAVGATVFDRWAGPGLAALLAELDRAGREPAAGRQALSVAIGLGLIAFAARRWLHRGQHAGAPPKWLGAVERIGSLPAFGLGALLLLINVDNVLVFLAGVNVIVAAGLGRAGTLLTFSLLTLAAAAPVLVPLAVSLARPAQSAARLTALRAWIGRASQGAVAVLLAGAGAWLVAWGLIGLLG